MNYSRLLSLVCMCCLASGCASTYLLSTQFVASTQAESPPEVFETPTYRDISKTITTVAVRAPDNCADLTAAAASGEATAGGTILKTTCGVEMAEIERGLAKRGYRVISWKIIAREMSVDKKTASEIAAALGAEVLFQINSLEKSNRTPGKDARWERKYFKSNEYGARVSEKSFDDRTRAYLKNSFLEQREKEIEYSGLLKRIAVTLDASAVLLKTGETIWYYRWTHNDPSRIDATREVLVICKDDDECLPVPRRQRPDGTATTTQASGESEAVSIAERPEDRENAAYYALSAEVIASLVKSFAAGKE